MLAFVRQEFDAPVTAIIGYADMIIDEVQERGLKKFLPDVQRIHVSGLQLQHMISALLRSGSDLKYETEEEFVAFRNKLRHDLRTPISAVKGYGEMLLEDMEDEGAEGLAADVRKLLEAADGLLTQIDQLVNFSRVTDFQPDIRLGAPQELVATTSIDAAALSAAMMAIGAVLSDDIALRVPRSRILVVDDTEPNRELLARRLEREGHIVSRAENGTRALELIEHGSFDLVLLDLMMPDISGYDVLCRLKKNEKHRHIPVVMVSALDDIESIARCIEAGAEDYLPKPFVPAVLKARVGASLEKKHLRDQAKMHLDRLEAELEATRKLQMGMVPTDFPAPTAERPVEVFAAMVPAREVGGDLYDVFFTLAGELCLVIGDVSGKGVPAAFFMARTTGLVRTMIPLLTELTGKTPAPCKVVERVNNELCVGNESMMFVTLFLAILDPKTGHLTYTNAGHNRPYIVAADEIVAVEGAEGIALGVAEGVEYESKQLNLKPNDILYLFTDGITEAQAMDSTLFSEERLTATLRKFNNATVLEILNGVDRAVAAFCQGHPQADDMTSMAVRILPSRA